MNEKKKEKKSYANECFVICYKNLHKYRLLPK